MADAARRQFQVEPRQRGEQRRQRQLVGVGFEAVGQRARAVGVGEVVDRLMAGVGVHVGGHEQVVERHHAGDAGRRRSPGDPRLSGGLVGQWTGVEGVLADERVVVVDVQARRRPEPGRQAHRGGESGQRVVVVARVGLGDERRRQQRVQARPCPEQRHRERVQAEPRYGVPLQGVQHQVLGREAIAAHPVLEAVALAVRIGSLLGDQLQEGRGIGQVLAVQSAHQVCGRRCAGAEHQAVGERRAVRCLAEARAQVEPVGAEAGRCAQVLAAAEPGIADREVGPRVREYRHIREPVALRRFRGALPPVAERGRVGEQAVAGGGLDTAAEPEVVAAGLVVRRRGEHGTAECRDRDGGQRQRVRLPLRDQSPQIGSGELAVEFRARLRHLAQQTDHELRSVRAQCRQRGQVALLFPDREVPVHAVRRVVQRLGGQDPCRAGEQERGNRSRRGTPAASAPRRAPVPARWGDRVQQCGYRVLSSCG